MSLRRVVLAIGLAAVLGVGAVWFFELRDTGTAVETTPQASVSSNTIERGAYLVRVGNCGACHTARGGRAFAGGRGIDTPFGTVYASNLTPDPEHGMGRWSAGQFWRALHEGRSADGRLLYPAFPYPNYTLVTRDDSDAMFDYLQSLPPVPQPDRAHALRFPYDTQFALAVWRLVFFRTAAFEPDASRPASWNRGAYLVQGLAHCGACHAERNVFGATRENLGLSGGLIPMTNWYAPSLTSPDEASLAGWDHREIAALLGTGSSARASTMGPMAEVVFRSTQYLSAEDLDAMVTAIDHHEAIMVAIDRNTMRVPNLMWLLATRSKLCNERAVVEIEYLNAVVGSIGNMPRLR